MINRKILYGYRIRNGILEIVPEEQQTVKRIFTLYNAGASYQGISDALNQGNIPYSQEVPLWNKHKVKRLLENPRYTDQDDYPAIAALGPNFNLQTQSGYTSSNLDALAPCNIPAVMGF